MFQTFWCIEKQLIALLQWVKTLDANSYPGLSYSLNYPGDWSNTAMSATEIFIQTHFFKETV